MDTASKKERTNHRTKTRMLRTGLIWSALIAFAPAWASGATVEGVQFPQSYVEDGIKLELRGVGLYRYMVVIKAYVGALYLPTDIPSDKALMDVAKRLEVEYFHAISGEDFGPATDQGISQNVDSETFARLKPKIDYHNSLYEDVQPGDRYSLTYLPGRGTHLAKNGRPLGVIEGADFAAGLFSIWIGPNPINASFKRAILGIR